MRHIVPLIWEAVAADAAKGDIRDRDAYCRHFAAMRPDLDRKVIAAVVDEAITFHSHETPPPGFARPSS